MVSTSTPTHSVQVPQRQPQPRPIPKPLERPFTIKVHSSVPY
jgi:hypothetical protein